ncbi:60S acidic ribosomal protein P2 [Coemansia sp. BCRC 34301]|nr:60S acidic ribosomal protein P2 [Coemansia sp. BCRC 34301]
MRYIAAYLLLQLANPEAAPSKEAVTKVISAAGIDVDAERLSQFFAAIEGKEISQLIAEGQSKLASVPSGGAAPTAGAAAAGGAAAPAAAAEKAAEAEEESDDDMGFGLFD